jgi:hypothetical protein
MLVCQRVAEADIRRTWENDNSSSSLQISPNITDVLTQKEVNFPWWPGFHTEIATA